jgi:hypothetical protein
MPLLERGCEPESSASSVTHHSAHLPAFSMSARRSRPIVPAKMMALRSLRSLRPGIVTSSKAR